MKQPDAIEIIEFSSGRIMEHTSKIFVAFAIAFLASLSLSSAAYIKKDFDFAKNFENNFKLPRTLREKRQSEHFELLAAEDNAAQSEDKLSDKRAIVEQIQETSLKIEKDREEPEKRNAHKDSEVITEINIWFIIENWEPRTVRNIRIIFLCFFSQVDTVPYKNVHEVIHALYADNKDLVEKRQELPEVLDWNSHSTA